MRLRAEPFAAATHRATDWLGRTAIGSRTISIKLHNTASAQFPDCACSALSALIGGAKDERSLTWATPRLRAKGFQTAMRSRHTGGPAGGRRRVGRGRSRGGRGSPVMGVSDTQCTERHGWAAWLLSAPCSMLTAALRRRIGAPCPFRLCALAGGLPCPNPPAAAVSLPPTLAARPVLPSASVVLLLLVCCCSLSNGLSLATMSDSYGPTA